MNNATRKDVHQQLESLLRAHLDAQRKAMLAVVERAYAGPTRSVASRRSPAAPSQRAPVGRARRPEAEITALSGRLCAAVAAEPGVGMTRLGAQLGVVAHDPALAAERRVFGKTVNLLQALPAAAAAAHLVGLVRERLAAEGRGEHTAPVSVRGQGENVIPLLAARPWRSRGVEVMAGLCAIAAVVAVVVIGVPGLRGPAGSDGPMLTAGSTAASLVLVTWRAAALARVDVVSAALSSGLTQQPDGSFVGDRQAAARFLLALKTAAATGGSDVSGTVPEQAERVVVVVVP